MLICSNSKICKHIISIKKGQSKLNSVPHEICNNCFKYNSKHDNKKQNRKEASALKEALYVLNIVKKYLEGLYENYKKNEIEVSF